MYNRYQGNTGHFVRVTEPEPYSRKRLPERMQTSAPANHELVRKRPPPARGGGLGSLLSAKGGGLGNLLPFGSIQDALSGILPKVLPDGLETEDLLLLLILYLMYKESGDKELLIILGAMFLL